MSSATEPPPDPASLPAMTLDSFLTKHVLPWLERRVEQLVEEKLAERLGE